MVEKQVDVEDKQEYLRKEILTQGYSPEDFLEFLISIKPEGGDISHWSMEELKTLVEEYRSK